ncbi:SGNH/GDSL hydrolase family protein [Sinorhizobium sp. BG8]|uniref:SGNH/GDSL hydrolase family protein n=1 Tax=Sinorhizobium sp. BG8 TaxID=2613773 RepID=UPI00193EA1BB|nr:SGNH/GDSL hydrolase family protein [Sinorhizobium sp. BG8]QRM56558.1 SGNH/GDSL hydrolase family protein [Sinorhizobium sp. BG8]
MFPVAIPLVALAMAAAGFGEVNARLRRVTDFPTYHADNQIGYIPSPNQAGSFQGRGQWAFNELSMGTDEPFAPSGKQDVLLIGDSIVFGRLTMEHHQRLAGRLNKISGQKVWPISAGSWSLQNEVQYLQDHPNVVAGVDKIVFILNSNDFVGPSSWRSEEHRPTKRPISALWYMLENRERKPLPQVPPEFKVKPKDALGELAALLSTTEIPVDVWFHPKKSELGNPGQLQKHADNLHQRLGDRVRIFHVADIRGWSKKAYSDGIHPNSRGYALMSRGIAATL